MARIDFNERHAGVSERLGAIIAAHRFTECGP